MPDDFGNIFDDPIDDVREDLGNVPSNNESYGFTYFVDGNAGSDGNDGLSKEKPFKTLAVAITASNLTIATHPALAGAGFAARNRINVKGDTLAEDLTVLAQKCDIVGLGSNDSNKRATVTGVHAIGAAGNHGCRFVHMRFQIKAAGGDIFTIPTTTGGVEFLDCVFDGHNAIKAGSAIIATASHMLRIENCRFIGEYSDAVIELGAGAMADCIIKNNWIEGVNQGIDVNSGLTMTQFQGVIEDNTIFTTLACINDASGKFALINNNGVTLAARGLKQAGAVVGNVLLAVGNFFTCSDGHNMPWPEAPPVWNETGGRNYYVDSNEGDAANSGTSWDDALDTLTAAMALSHANIGLGSSTWAARNQIFYKGDSNSENLTTLAQKTDIIGVGSGGGFRTQPQIVGTHAIAAAYGGCRFYNMGFTPAANTDDIFTFFAGCHGLEFHECTFESTYAAVTAGSAIIVEASAQVIIDNCVFGNDFSDAVIEVLAGQVDGMIIRNNIIRGGEVGIEFVTGITVTHNDSPVVADNIINTETICINDVDAAEVLIINNNCITVTADGGAAGANIIVGDVQRGNGNKVSASDATNADWPVTVALA